MGKVEEIVSRQIEEKLPVFSLEVALPRARQILGLRAVFGEVKWDGETEEFPHFEKRRNISCG